MTGARHVIISADEDGQRLDRWLKKQGFSFAAAQKIVRTGQVRIDGKRAKADTKLIKGQDVRLPPSDPPKKKAQKFSESDRQFLKDLTLYEDEDIIALNKPAGLATQGGSGIKKHIDGMLPALAGKDGVAPRLVHRLDRETSGVLLLAKNAETARKLGRMFQGKDIRKIYWALCAPAPEMQSGDIRAALRKGDGAEKEKMIIDEKDGQRAQTFFDVIERAGTRAAFVAFWPRTGRTHQIRVHAAASGFAVLGDEKYAPTDQVEGLDPAPGLHLHAREVSFQHPARREVVTIKAPLPADKAESWCSLGFDPKSKVPVFEDIDL